MLHTGRGLCGSRHGGCHHHLEYVRPASRSQTDPECRTKTASPGFGMLLLRICVGFLPADLAIRRNRKADGESRRTYHVIPPVVAELCKESPMPRFKFFRHVRSGWFVSLFALFFGVFASGRAETPFSSHSVA